MQTVMYRMDNKVLLYSTRNYIQYPVINHNGKEYKKECICVYIFITESLCYIAEINKHCKSTILQQNKFLKNLKGRK